MGQRKKIEENVRMLSSRIEYYYVKKVLSARAQNSYTDPLSGNLTPAIAAVVCFFPLQESERVSLECRYKSHILTVTRLTPLLASISPSLRHLPCGQFPSSSSPTVARGFKSSSISLLALLFGRPLANIGLLLLPLVD